MKKTTMQYVVEFLNEWIKGEGGEELVRDELVNARNEMIAELNKGKEKADANRAIYAEIHDAVITTLKSTTVPITAQELADETGYAKGKIVYGLRNYWADEVEKIEGKVNTYTAK